MTRQTPEHEAGNGPYSAREPPNGESFHQNKKTQDTGLFPQEKTEMKERVRLYIITGPDDKTGEIAGHLRILPADTADDIENQAVAIKERLNRERGVRGVIGVCVDRNVRCGHRSLRHARRTVRRYRRNWEYFSPVGETVNFIAVFVEGETVTIRENRWDYDRELRQNDLRERIRNLLNPPFDEDRIPRLIERSLHYDRRLSRKYGLHISKAKNPQFPYFVREYGECFTEKEIERAVHYGRFDRLKERRENLREGDDEALEELLDDTMTFIERLGLPDGEPLRSLLDRYDEECLPSDGGRTDAEPAILDDALRLIEEHFKNN